MLKIPWSKYGRHYKILRKMIIRYVFDLTVAIREIYNEEKVLDEFNAHNTSWRQEGQMETETILLYMDGRTGDARECNGIDNSESYKKGKVIKKK